MFSYAGKRHYLSLGLADNKVNRKAAETKATLIESDIAYERFDPTLAKYKPQSVLSTITPTVTPIDLKPSLADLWEKFLEYKRPQCCPNTFLPCPKRVVSIVLEDHADFSPQGCALQLP